MTPEIQSKITEACDLLDEALCAADEEGTLEEVHAEIVEGFTDPLMAGLLMQFVYEGQPREEMLQRVAHVANVFGPDHAQALYQFAVRVTKIA